MRIDPEIEKYLKRKRWIYSDRNPSQYIVKTCPLCGDTKNHFYINKTTGQFLCWKCDEQGNLYHLKKALGDTSPIVQPIKSSPIKIDKDKYNNLRRKVNGWHNALKANEAVQDIIKKKYGFGPRAIKRFKLGIRTVGKKKKTRWLVIPQYQNKKLSCVKYRTLPPSEKKFRREEGMSSVLFNIDRLDTSLDYVFLFEGEPDTITADAYLKLKNCLGVTVGARGFKEEWIDVLSDFSKIYVCYDSDIAGQRGAEKIAKRLGMNRCYNIELPVEDGESKIELNDWWQSGNNQKDFKNLVDLSKPFDILDIASFSSVLDDLQADLFFNKRLDQAGLVTQWDNVNQLIGSFVPGDLIVLSGPAKIGKSTFALNVLLHHALYGTPVLNYCLEMRPERIGAKMISYFRGVGRTNISIEDVTYVKTRFGRKPFYLAHSTKFEVDQVFETIRDGVQRYGIELMVFDHLHFLIRSRDNTAQVVSATVRDFKLMAEELKIPVILICQPRKLNRAARMTTEDLRDSSAIGQDADTVIIIHRERIPEKDHTNVTDVANEQIFASEVDVVVDATRFNPGGIAKLYYNGEMSRYFKNIEEERRFLIGEKEI